jgi:zinc transport system substrate-binding protein
MGRKALGVLWVAALLGAGCAGPAEGEGRPTVVASFYPLAYAAERVGGSEFEVVDLTPPGTEAHDVELSLEARAAIEEADLILYMGDIGFQPQVEDAVDQAQGRVVGFADQIIIAPDGDVPEGTDPHVWLDPGAMRTMTSFISNALVAEDPAGEDRYRARADQLKSELERLNQRYAGVLSVTRCRYRTAVVSHEAFNYMIGRYGFEQFGLAGLTPEGEPTAGRLAEAERLLQEGEAGAVFYEAGDEAQRIAESVASDAGVPALPLSTLESEPPEGDYLSVMEDNLESLREGLGCA